MTSVFLRSALVVAILWGACSHGEARPFRTGPAYLPNPQFNCQTCHLSAAGGGARNAFGERVRQLVTPNGTEKFWPTIFDEDSDGDGVSNGLELGDTDGDLQIDRGPNYSNPGLASDTISLPNTAPSFNSTAVTAAVKGIAYSYQATARDSESNMVTFFKVTGPAWLTVSPTGLVSGTPPDDANAVESVTIRAIDNGSPPAFADQSFNLAITASFLGWQRLNFAAGENDPNADPAVDGEADGIPNFIEYATRGSPTNANTFVFPLTFDVGERATIAVEIRDDDPNLEVVAEIAADARFGLFTTVDPVVSDPTANDGLKRLAFTDPIANAAGVRRFIRLKFSNGQ